MTPLFSIIIATGRLSNGAMIGCPDEHLFLKTMRSLASQTAQNFELIIVDSLGCKRSLKNEIASLSAWQFPWKVVTPSSWWLENGFWALQNAFNTGFKHSAGSYLYFCGDCCEFPANAMATAQDLIQQGHIPSFLFAYRQSGKLLSSQGEPTDFSTIEEAVSAERWNSGMARDSRWQFVEHNHGFVPKSNLRWDMMYGYSCIPREDFIYVNGYDENFDGDKALGDVEIGSRLKMAGRWTLSLSRNLYVYENKHHGLDASTFHNGSPPGTAWNAIRSNYDLIYLMRGRKQWRANSMHLTESDCIKVINGEIMNLPGYPKCQVIPGEPGYKAQRHWIENQPVFDL